MTWLALFDRHLSRLPCCMMLVLAATGCGRSDLRAPRLDAHDWRFFEELFVEPSGRVRDTANGDISHSEGQGYAMLFAVAADDERSFRRIWSWTKKNLQVRDDALLAWRWDPAVGKVTDKNNATDGDLLVAWALLEAAARWEESNLRDEALHILSDVKKHLIVDTTFGPGLLPGVDGFVDDAATVTLNLSYWIFPALNRFAREDEDRLWLSVLATGQRLIELARFGRYALPSNWISVKDEIVRTGEGREPLYGYDAVRIPIHLCLAQRLGGAPLHTALLTPFRRFYDQPKDISYREWRVLDDSVGGAMPHEVVDALRTQLSNACATADKAAAGSGVESVYYETALLLLMRMYVE